MISSHTHNALTCSAGFCVKDVCCRSAKPQRPRSGMTNMALMQVDKLVETKGLDYLDREKAKRHARQQAEQMYDQQVLHCVFAVDPADV